jgi:hypothetical protein
VTEASAASSKFNDPVRAASNCAMCFIFSTSQCQFAIKSQQSRVKLIWEKECIRYDAKLWTSEEVRYRSVLKKVSVAMSTTRLRNKGMPGLRPRHE